MGVIFTSFWFHDEDTIMFCAGAALHTFKISTCALAPVPGVDKTDLKPTAALSYGKFFKQSRCYIALGHSTNNHELCCIMWQQDFNKWCTLTVHIPDRIEKACPWQNNKFVLFYTSGKLELLTISPNTMTTSIEEIQLGVPHKATTATAYKDYIVFINEHELIFYNVPSKKINSIVPINNVAANQSVHKIQPENLLSEEYDDYLFLVNNQINVDCVFHILHVPTRQWTQIISSEQIKSAAQYCNVLVGYNKIYVRGNFTFFSVEHKIEADKFQKRIEQEQKLRNVTIICEN